MKEKYPTTKVAFYAADLTTEGAINKLFADTILEFGRIDIVVNTVGRVLKKALAEVTEEEYDTMSAYVLQKSGSKQQMLTEILRVNSKSAFFILKASANNVADGGKIITIVTSLLGAFTGGYTPYAGTKAPVEHFSRGLAKELLGKRISVNCIAPGPMNTRKF